MFKKRTEFVPTFIITLVQLFLLEFGILSLLRIIFYFGFKTADVSDLPKGVVIKAFKLGTEFDMVACTYALFLPTLLLLLNNYFYRKTLFFHKAAYYASLGIFWLYALISAADFPYFKQFGSHLNKQAFLWADSPLFVLKLILGNISYYGYLFFFILIAAIIYKIIKKIFIKAVLNLEQKKDRPLKTTLGFLLLLPFIIAGARGRLSSKSTTHEGMAIVSNNQFVNQVALNPDFTMFRSLLFQKVKNYKVPETIDKSILFARKYLGITEPYKRSIARLQKADSTFMQYNVVIVCMESMSSYKTGIHSRENLTPAFNAIIKESVLFDNFFSSGIHTFNGLFSTCSSYPSMLTEHGLRRYTKKAFTTLGNLLKKKNYQTYIAVTHDPVFDNMEGFFRLNGYDKTLSSDNFPGSKVISATGVADHELLNLFIETINSSHKSKPFLGFIMTGSDHGPWAIPGDIDFKPTANTDEKRSTQYADWALGEFMKKCRQQSWYSNTLFVFLGDHGYATEGTYEMPLSYHHIPLVLHKPNTLGADTFSQVGYQPDVTATVAGILNLDYVNEGFGINLLKEKHPFVFFTADDKIGCVDNNGNYFYEMITQRNKSLRRYWKLDQNEYYTSRKPLADSLEEGTKSMLEAAEYFIRQEYFTY